MNEKALLIGNDINSINQNYDWEKLINDLKSYAKLNSSLNYKNKPFPLIYEEIYLKAAKEYKTSENRLKTYIASKTRNIEPNSVHKSLLGLEIDQIMTTNYDLTFEKSAGLKKYEIANKGIINENKYSLFRYHQVSSKRIWHIHGSEIAPNSITLGYEHYGAYLQYMRNYVASGTQDTYKNYRFSSIKKRFINGELTGDSWIDLFFTNDIYIIGLNFDFVEMHLWWLLTYRARAIAEEQFSINNKIVYYYPEIYTISSKHKLEMFEANGVETVPETSYGEGRKKLPYYNKVIERINN